jgi:hypothetical protein
LRDCARRAEVLAAITVTFETMTHTTAGLEKLSVDEKTWQDDLQITYWRSQ